jgi:hypothetical protein
MKAGGIYYADIEKFFKVLKIILAKASFNIILIFSKNNYNMNLRIVNMIVKKLFKILIQLDKG